MNTELRDAIALLRWSLIGELVPRDLMTQQRTALLADKAARSVRARPDMERLLTVDGLVSTFHPIASLPTSRASGPHLGLGEL